MNKLRTLLPLLLFFALPLASFASVEVIGSLKHVHVVNPGDVVKGQIQIQNNDATDQEVRIYQTDFLYNLQDQTFYEDPGANKRTNANWIEYSPKTVILKSKEIRNVDYEITIPKSDTLSGTYWSVIMIEGVTPIDVNQKGELSIRTVTRYAVQVVTEMNNKGKGSLKFLEPTLIQSTEADTSKQGKADKKVYLAVDLQNDGDHYIAPEVNIELYDQDGKSVKTISAPRRGLFPQTSVRFRLDLAGLPSKKTYTAMIVAAGQDSDVFGLEYTLYF